MNKYKLEYSDAIEIIEADFIEVYKEAICFYKENPNEEGELIAVREICAVTKEGIKTEVKVVS